MPWKASSVSENWLEKLDPPDETESAMLDFAQDRQKNSRLSCQIKISDELDGLEVTLAPGTTFNIVVGKSRTLPREKLS